jgi:hypothetical protein
MQILICNRIHTRSIQRKSSGKKHLKLHESHEIQKINVKKSRKKEQKDVLAQICPFHAQVRCWRGRPCSYRGRRRRDGEDRRWAVVTTMDDAGPAPRTAGAPPPCPSSARRVSARAKGSAASPRRSAPESTTPATRRAPSI